MPQNGKLAGKRALVTGAGTGIGRGVAETFAQEGASVALHYAHSAQGAEEAASEINDSGGSARAFPADLRDLAAIDNMVADAKAFLGGLDILVNNAGITMNKPFLDVTPDQFDTLFGVNIRGMYFTTQKVVPDMLSRGAGAVINLSSVHASTGMTEHTVYASTKSAIVGFTRVLALELGPKGVRVNGIAPGWILVENHLKVLGEDLDRESLGEDIPAGIVGSPEDIGHLATYLASDESRYLLGQTIIIDGGQTSIMPLSGDFREPRKEQWGQGYVDGI